MGLHPDVQKEKDAAWLWWRKVGTGITISNSVAGKTRENPDFGVAVGAILYSAGQHEIDFNVTRSTVDAYAYVGFAVPGIVLDSTWCRRDASDEVFYYFGCGFTNALRNGWDDVVSKEVGGPTCKIPRMMSTDRVRAYLDMDAGELCFALFRPDEPGQWKMMPGKITGINSPVCAAACMQDRCSVSLGESSKMSTVDFAKEENTAGEENKVKRPKVDKYAHVQSKFLSDSRLNPINSMMRQLGEEMRNRRRGSESTPPYVQLSKISLVESAMGIGGGQPYISHVNAYNTPASPHRDLVGLQFAKDTYPQDQHSQQHQQLHCQSSGVPANWCSPEGFTPSASDVLTGVDVQQHNAQQSEWNMQQNGVVSGASIFKLPRPSSSLTHVQQKHWASSAIINTLLHNDTQGTIGSPRDVSPLTPRRRRFDQELRGEDMSLGTAMMMRSANRSRNAKRHQPLFPTNPSSRSSQEDAVHYKRDDATAPHNAMRVLSISSPGSGSEPRGSGSTWRSSSVVATHAISPQYTTHQPQDLSHLEIERTRSSPHERALYAFGRAGGQQRVMMGRGARGKPTQTPGRHTHTHTAADPAVSVTTSATAAKLMVMRSSRSDRSGGVGGRQGGYETNLAAPPNATVAEREEMAELIVERKRGHLGPGVGNIMLRSFPSSVPPDNQPRGVRGGGGGGNPSTSHSAGNARTGGVATPKGAQQWDQVPAQGLSQILDTGASFRQFLSRSIKERSESKGMRQMSQPMDPNVATVATRQALARYNQVARASINKGVLSISGEGGGYRARQPVQVPIKYGGPGRAVVTNSRG